jgi:methylated-DNA-[protein]-cysteine S-methyltransferase
VNEAALTLETPIGALGIVASDAGLRRVRLPGSSGSRTRERGSEGAAAIAERAALEIGEYLAAERTVIDLPLDWARVDARHRRVLEALLDAAPFGTTITYGELGRRAGEPDPRDIGVFMARNPFPLVVPCHRVVAADSLGGYGGGIELKRRLLELEHLLPARLEI